MPSGDSVKWLVAGEEVRPIFAALGGAVAAIPTAHASKAVRGIPCARFARPHKSPQRSLRRLNESEKICYLHTEQVGFPARFDGRFVRNETVSNVQ